MNSVIRSRWIGFRRRGLGGDLSELLGARWMCSTAEDSDDKVRRKISHRTFTWPPLKRRPPQVNWKKWMEKRHARTEEYLKFRREVDDEMKVYQPPSLVAEMQKHRTDNYEMRLSQRFGLFSVKGTGPNEEFNEEEMYSDVYTEHGDVVGVEPARPSDMFMVVVVGARQIRVVTGDVISVENLPFDVGEIIRMDKVVMCATRFWSVFGRPYVSNASVTAVVQAQMRSKHIQRMIWNKGKRHRRRYGHSQTQTVLRILDVEYEPPMAGRLEELRIKPVPQFAPIRAKTLTGDDRK
ncbi:hypothetical protein NDN08_008168 [Rhodosorus marinus]|uniref:Large ribosomal subunit protein bL21m n=1 Tax=Rhodosorus marinus TaxID=101924 RepID=A0AAV8UZL1_9RHOD|nr:hypothetical protein NDN08_008168 [Rhodosorus marinus]